MKIKLNNRDKFRFTEKGHVHEMLINDKWEIKPGCSTIGGMFDDKGWLGWWSAGQALAPMGWMKLEKDGSNKAEVCEAAAKGLISLLKYQGMPYDEYSKFLDKCYRAHAKETKDTAEAGTELHGWLESYVKAKIEGNSIGGLVAPSVKFETQLSKFFKWERENQVEWLASEVQVGSLMFGFCGILDFICHINGRIVIGDFKTSSIFKYTNIPQLVGLKQCVQEMGQPIDDLMVVRLARDGDFEVHPINIDFETELLAFLKAKDFYQARNLFKARCKSSEERGEAVRG